jgi:hypothetical protein
MQELVRYELVIVEDDYFTLGNSIDIDWLTAALKTGNRLAWKLVDALDTPNAIEKKFNGAELKRIGDLGEFFLMQSLKEFHTEELHDKIDHVSLRDDTLGYDIEAPSHHDPDIIMQLEVKTTVRPVDEYFDFFLSRNEFEVGRSKRNWCIVAIAISNGEPQVIGHLYCYQFESRIPVDSDPSVKWNSCKIKVSLSQFRPGIP